MTNTPPPPPPPQRPSTPPPPPPPSGDGGDGRWDAGFVGDSPTSTVPRYDTEQFGAVRGAGGATTDAYGFPIGDSAPLGPDATRLMPGVGGADADGDGVEDSVQAAEAAAHDASASEANKKTESSGLPMLRPTRDQAWPKLLALFGPLLLIIVAFVFIGSALGTGTNDGSDSSSSQDDSSEDTSEDQSSSDTASADAPVAPPPPIIAAEGDPLATAFKLANDHAVGKSSDAPLAPQIIAVRSDVAGPDSYALRLVVIRYIGSKDDPTAKIACADWDVDVANQEVTERGETILGEEQGRIDVPTRELDLKTACDAATIG